MPFYESETITREQLFELRKTNRCQVCRSRLDVYMDFDIHKAYLACNSDQTHEGIEREAPPPFEPNIVTRREFMEQEHGEAKALALRRFDAVATLSRETATDMLKIMWPNAEKASPAEFAKALGLCVDYGLDPRLNELFMLPFNKKDKEGKIIGVTYETVRGIKATRKVALRKHKYSYIDATPRYMTEEEEKKVYKEVDPNKIRYITKLKDMETGAEFPGYGQWSKYRTWTNPKTHEVKQYLNEPKGMDKGNSMENMAAIRSERAALERGYPADMPSSRIPVVDEEFIEAEYHVVPENEEPEAPEEAPGEPLIRPEGEDKIGEPPATEIESALAKDWEDLEKGGEPILSSPKGEQKPETPRQPPSAPAEVRRQKPPRDPNTIKTILDLYHACNEDFTVIDKDGKPQKMQPSDVLKELGISSQSDIADTPANCYRQIAAVR